jgi:hypothetical protein
MDPFGLQLFSFFHAHYSQICSFDGLTEFFHILSQFLNSLTKSSSVFL